MKQTSITEDGWLAFVQLCSELKTADEINELFNLFFTIEERKDVADRYLIVKSLLSGKQTQREMAHDLQVSIAKITRGSNSLKMLGENFRNFLLSKIK